MQTDIHENAHDVDGPSTLAPQAATAGSATRPPVGGQPGLGREVSR